MIHRETLYEFTREAYQENRRLVAPLLGFPGVALENSSIKLAQQNSSEHFKILGSLVHRFNPDVIFPLMDLSVEANALGRYTDFPVSDSPTVHKHPFEVNQIDQLREVNISADSRMLANTQTVELLSQHIHQEVLVGAYVTGPYTLAALLMGAEDAAMATLTHPGLLKQVCQFATEVIAEYTRMLIEAGAEVICILEPSAVMLGPDQFARFSGEYVNDLVKICKQNQVESIYHVCGNSMHLIDKMIETKISALSLDSDETGMDLEQVIQQVPENIVIIGNISPATTMFQGSREQVREETAGLLFRMREYPNFILSTGCDLPLETPLENIEMFMKTGREYQM